MSSFSRGLERVLEWILITLMITLTIIVVGAVIYRKLGESLSWYDEVAAIGLAWVTYYGAALAALRRGHIGLDSVLMKIPTPARTWVAGFGSAVTIGFFLIMAWAGFEVLAVLEGETLVSLTWVPVQLTQSVIPIGAILFIICELLSLPGYLRAVAAGRSLAHE